MARVKDFSPKFRIKSAERELEVPGLFQDTPLQIMGGMLAGSREISHGKVKLQGIDERLLFGDAVSPSEGIGVFVGKDGDDYEFRVGDPAGQTIHWDGSTLIIGGFVEEGGAAADVNSNATTISGGKITTNSITADKMNVSTLSAITANIGAITAGSITGITITGGTIRTASSGSRVELTGSNNRLTIWDGSDERARMESSSVRLFGDGRLRFLEVGSTTIRGSIGTTSTAFHIAGLSNRDLLLTGENEEVKVSALSKSLQLLANDDVTVITGGDFVVNGTPKTAIVPTSRGYRALYTNESPELWFMDFCKSKDTVDPQFLEVTEGEMKFIRLEDGGYQVWRRRKGFSKLRFEEKTKEEYIRNNEFWRTK